MDPVEKVELSHEPVAGYRTALGVVIAIASIYLALVFFL
jgi:hypothetical protein